MLALKKKRETEAKAKAEAEAAAAASPGGGAAEKVSILGIGGKKKKDGGKGGAGGSKKRTPGEIRIQKGETEHACVSYVSDCGVSHLFARKVVGLPALVMRARTHERCDGVALHDWFRRRHTPTQHCSP